MKIENAKKIEVWQFEIGHYLYYLLRDGVIYLYDKGEYINESEELYEEVRQHFEQLEIESPTTYEQLEMEARIKKLEWTIAEQQLEIERLRQKELELSKGKNDE